VTTLPARKFPKGGFTSHELNWPATSRPSYATRLLVRCVSVDLNGCSKTTTVDEFRTNAFQCSCLAYTGVHKFQFSHWSSLQLSSCAANPRYHVPSVLAALLYTTHVAITYIRHALSMLQEQYKCAKMFTTIKWAANSLKQVSLRSTTVYYMLAPNVKLPTKFYLTNFPRHFPNTSLTAI